MLRHAAMAQSPLSFLLALALAGLSGTALFGQPVAQQHIEITGSEKLRIVYDCDFTWPAGKGYAEYHIPVPPTTTGTQRLDDVVCTLKGKSIGTDNAGRRLMNGTLQHQPGDERQVHWKVEVTGTFQTRQLVDGSPRSGEIANAPGSGEFLASTESIDWKSDAFQSWLDSAGLRRGKDEPAVKYGARLYAYLRAHGQYSYPPSSAWVASAVCRRLRSDCGGFSLVYVATCRANRIPARMLVGQCFKARTGSDGVVELTGERQAHVIAEFFDPRIGWIPEDISGTFLKTPGYKDLNFFGRDPGYFFAWHTDTDFYFDTPRKPNAHMQWIQNPNLWFSESADSANNTATRHWSVKAMK